MSLARRFAEGEEAAAGELYDLLADRVHHFLVVCLRSRQEADDALQETFLRLMRHRAKLADVENLTAYVFTVARGEALRWLQRRNRRAEVPVLAAEECFVASEINMEDVEHVAAALASLPQDLREVVELKVYSGLVLREIAEVTGTPLGTVASRYRTALAKLKERFQRCLK